MYTCVCSMYVNMFLSICSFQCLAAGSYIAHREEESEELRPYAAHITELIHQIRLALRKQVLAGQYDLPQSVSVTLLNFNLYSGSISHSKLWSLYKLWYTEAM